MIDFKIKWKNTKLEKQISRTTEFLENIGWGKYDNKIYTISGPTWKEDDCVYIHILTENRNNHQKKAEELLLKLKENRESKQVWIWGSDEASKIILDNMLDAPYNENSENFEKYWMVSHRE